MTLVLEIESSPLALIVAESGLAPAAAALITEQFAEFFANAEEWKTKAGALTVTDEAQVAEMKMARVGRLALRGIRISVEHARKELKEDSLKQGKAIDAVAKALTAAIEPIERHLELQETFAVRAKAARDTAQKASRTAVLAHFPVNATFFDLVNMPQSAFDELVDSLKIVEANKVEAAAKAEVERLAAIEVGRVKAAAEAAAIETQRLENEQLRAAAEVAEQARIKADRDAAETLRISTATAVAQAKAVWDADAKAAIDEAHNAVLSSMAAADFKAMELIRKSAEAAVAAKVAPAATNESRPTISPDQVASLALFAPYLAAGIDVESSAWGRGRLVGLPYSQLWEQVHIDALFTYDGSDAVASGVEEVRNCKPVLYAVEDRQAVVAAVLSSQRTGAHVDIDNSTAVQLERMARAVDTARALGIALNLPEGSYVRKEVANA